MKLSESKGPLKIKGDPKSQMGPSKSKGPLKIKGAPKMGQQRLCDYAILSIKRVERNRLNYENLIDEFTSMKTGKVDLNYIYAIRCSFL